MNEKRSQEFDSINPEYVTGQINICILSCILELLLRQFCCLIFDHLNNFNMLLSDNAFSQRLEKIF